MSLIENINDKNNKEDNEWIAVKSFNNVSNNSNQEILNLVSLSVENEKVKHIFLKLPNKVITYSYLKYRLFWLLVNITVL